MGGGGGPLGAEGDGLPFIQAQYLNYKTSCMKFFPDWFPDLLVKMKQILLKNKISPDANYCLGRERGEFLWGAGDGEIGLRLKTTKEDLEFRLAAKLSWNFSQLFQNSLYFHHHWSELMRFFEVFSIHNIQDVPICSCTLKQLIGQGLWATL